MSCTVCHSWLCKCNPTLLRFDGEVLTMEEREAIRAAITVLQAAAIEHRAARPHKSLTAAESNAQLVQGERMGVEKDRHATVLQRMAIRLTT